LLTIIKVRTHRFFVGLYVPVVIAFPIIWRKSYNRKMWVTAIEVRPLIVEKPAKVDNTIAMVIYLNC